MPDSSLQFLSNLRGNTKLGKGSSSISEDPRTSGSNHFLSQWFEKLTGRDLNQEHENEAFARLAIENGDEYARRDPRSKAGIMLAGDPKGSGASLASNWLDTLKLQPTGGRVAYSGGPSKMFWSEDAGRAASYADDGIVNTVYNIPDEVWSAGQKEATRLGQPTRWDSVLPSNYVNKAVTQKVKPPRTIIDASGNNDQFLSGLGIKKLR